MRRLGRGLRDRRGPCLPAGTRRSSIPRSSRFRRIKSSCIFSPTALAFGLAQGGEELDFRTSTLVRQWDLLNWYKTRSSRAFKSDAEKITEKVKNTFPSDAIGWAKTHDLFISPLAATDAAARLAYLSCREVCALISPEWTWKSGVMGPLHPKDDARFPEAERYLDAVFRVWEKRIADWGDYGFIYYYTGPHISYTEKYADPYRYAQMTSYTLRPDLWRAYARSGDRSIRELARNTNRVVGDSAITHWDGNGKVKGLFLDTGAHDDFPFHWQGRPMMEVMSSTDLNDFLYLYNLAGCRRGKDVVEEYAEGIKRFWTPEKTKSTGERIIMKMRTLLQCYSLTWDPALRELAEATTDYFTDSEGAIGLTKERPERQTTYKTMSDIAALFDAWEILGHPRYHDLAMKISKYWWGCWLGDYPVDGYVQTVGSIGNFLYNETGNPAYAEMLALKVRQAACGYNPTTKSVTGQIQANGTTFIFEGIPYSEDLMVRTGADREPVASWVAYDDFGCPASIVLRKSDNGILGVELRTDGATEGLNSGRLRRRHRGPAGRN